MNQDVVANSSIAASLSTPASWNIAANRSTAASAY